MIEFLQDYETKALPPEVFTKGQQVSRTDDSEQYLVGLGVAAFLTADGLVDLDHRPIETTTIEVVVPGERRFSTPGRAGELALGIDAPQRATTGPGNAALFGGDQQTAAIGADIDRLTAELAEANAESDDLATTLTSVTAERDTHVLAITALSNERDAAFSDRDAARQQRDSALGRAEAAERERDGHAATITSLTAERDALNDRLNEATERASAAEAEATALRAESSENETPPAKQRGK